MVPAETQHPRTQLAWTRTALSTAAVGLIEVRLLVGSNPSSALVTLGLSLALVLVLGTTAAVRLHRDRDALALNQTTSSGRSVAVIAGTALLVALLGLAAVLSSPGA